MPIKYASPRRTEPTHLEVAEADLERLKRYCRDYIRAVNCNCHDYHPEIHLPAARSLSIIASIAFDHEED